MTLLPRRLMFAFVRTIAIALAIVLSATSGVSADVKKPLGSTLVQAQSLSKTAARSYSKMITARSAERAERPTYQDIKKTYLVSVATAKPYLDTVTGYQDAVSRYTRELKTAKTNLTALQKTGKPAPTATPTASPTASPEPSADPTAPPTPTSSVTPSPSPSPTATKPAKKTKKVSLKKQIAAAKAIVKAATWKLNSAKKKLTIATDKAKPFLEQKSAAYQAYKTEVTKYQGIAQAFATATSTYNDQLKSLNELTSQNGFSGDTCLPGQQIKIQTSWDCGTVISVDDGDTITVRTDNGEMIVRTLGVQAPEVDHLPVMPAQCGGYEAKALLKSLIKVGQKVQLRSQWQNSYNAHTSDKRYYRAIYIKDSSGNFTYDTAKALYQAGDALWFPLGWVPGSQKHESSYNKEYRILIEKAIVAKRGLWSTKLCADAQITGYDPQRDISPIVWAQIDPPGKDTVMGEYVIVKNPGARDLDLSYWKIRDTALNFFTFPKGTIVKPGRVVKVFVGGKISDGSIKTNIFYWGKTETLFQNYEGTYFTGDAVYLSDRQGANRSGGNLRAWFHFPCLNSAYDVVRCNAEPATDTVAVPNVLTMTRLAAINALKGARLSTKVVKVETADPTKVGKVIKQSIAAGTTKDVWTVVTITVAIAKPVVTPSPTPTPTGSPTATPTPAP